MNKQQLIAKMMEKTKTDLSKAAVEKFANAFIDTVKESVAAGDPVQLVGFGTFEVRQRASRECRNPQTGETLLVPACKVPAFKPGKAFKEIVK